jgi:hypothetical protein
MVGLTTSSSLNYQEKLATSSGNASSVTALYSDPDLLIREYFLSSSSQRAIARKAIIQSIKSVSSIFAILSWGASGKARDGYDGAVNLLAEIDRLSLLKSAIEEIIAKNYIQMLQNASTRSFAENFLEILIKAIACAYKIDATQRLRLLTQVLPQIDQRMLKAALIDALTILSSDLDSTAIKPTIMHFIADPDPYIKDYAMEALQDIG